ncbi:MAG: hypothetical protein AB7V16_02535 [Vulcanibacillus sp.]
MSKKFFLVVAILALSVSLVACGSTETPAPATDAPAAPATDAPAAPAADAPAAYVPIPAANPDNQPLVDMIVPSLNAKVKSKEITQDRMNEIVTQVGTGELSIEQVQAIMQGTAN